jgi:hypothetical protein
VTEECDYPIWKGECIWISDWFRSPYRPLPPSTSHPILLLPRLGRMASKNLPFEKYQYVNDKNGARLVQVPSQEENKDEESPVDYNPGGYLAVRVGDTFKDQRYVVVRKLGCVHFLVLSLSIYILFCLILESFSRLTYAIFAQMGSFLDSMASQGSTVRDRSPCGLLFIY